MENPYEAYRAKAAARNQANRDPRRDARRRDHNPGQHAGGGGNNRGGGGGGPNKYKWWDKYEPGEYDPNNPYYQPPGPGQPHPNVSGMGKRLGEQNPEAMWGNQLARGGQAYNPGSAQPYQQYLRDQFMNAQQGFQQSQIDRPGLTWWRYLQRTPSLHGGEPWDPNRRR